MGVSEEEEIWKGDKGMKVNQLWACTKKKEKKKKIRPDLVNSYGGKTEQVTSQCWMEQSLQLCAVEASGLHCAEGRTRQRRAC